MIVFPAVDIKDGKCVRLKQGKADEVTLFSEDPVDMALYWESLGAEWLHVVDLDGAFEGATKNLYTVEKICRKVNIPVQVGGGIRNLDSASSIINAGAERIIVGTVALRDKGLLEQMCNAFPEKIGVSLDAENGRLKVKGWVEDSGVFVDDVMDDLERIGVSFLVYTDISRDGMQTGVNIEAVKKVVGRTNIPVIAAGGVKSVEDLKFLFPLGKEGLEGIIVGRALYERSFDLKEALEWLKDQDK